MFPRILRLLSLFALVLISFACALPARPGGEPSPTTLVPSLSPSAAPSLTVSATTRPSVTPSPTRPPTLTPTPTPRKTAYIPFPKGAVTGIDYSQPQKYRLAGKQTVLTDAQFNEISQKLQLQTQDWKMIQSVFTWKNTFPSVPAGGKWVGKNTAAQILQTRQLTGCHDHAILMAAVLRRYGIPVVLVDALGIQWALTAANPPKNFSGHVFIEVYLNERWSLIDATSGAYTLEYDPNNRVLPFTNPNEPQGFYSMLKGLDPEDYGVTQIEQLNQIMTKYAVYLQSIRSELTPPPYKLQQLK